MTDAARPVCDFFVDYRGEECIVEIFTTDDGYVEEFSISPLMENGSKGDPFELSEAEEEQLGVRAQEFYNDWVNWEQQ